MSERESTPIIYLRGTPPPATLELHLKCILRDAPMNAQVNMDKQILQQLLNMLKSKRIRQAHKEHPGHWGRPRLQVNLELIITLRSEGKSYRDIAKAAGCTHTTVADLLSDTHK